MSSTSTVINGKAGMKIEFVSEKILRVRYTLSNEFTETGLERYGFLKELKSPALKVEISEKKGLTELKTAKFKVTCASDGRMSVTDIAKKRTILDQTSVDINSKKARVSFKAKPEEDWIGFGDQTRTRLYHRGTQADLYMKNVKSYIPVPFFMSTEGFGIFVNTTHRIIFDMCQTDKDKFSWTDYRGESDYFILLGKDFKENLDLYTDLTGKPKLPPEWAFGLWYICRTQANDYEAVNDALNFRREEIPCDVIGLEPGWMDGYDFTVDKKWNEKLFPIPSWAANGPHTFISALKRMGFHFELWECNEYDLSYEEERKLGLKISDKKENAGNFHKDAEIDEHFSNPRFADAITKKTEAWFEHHKKFVDQGVDFFKQDGSNQVCEHPDRIWGNGMLDGEMHNIYPLLYVRQMYEGFANHTGRRPVVFTPAGWAGFQSWCGTWTGDTGGRLDTLGAMLNTSIAGHSWSTNDMEVAQPEGIHFGYLQPWSQINSWTYFRMPWIQGDKLKEMHKFYSQFRARLIPYIYSWAYQSTITASPLMLPLTLEFPDSKECRTNLHQYLLGRDLMVGIYKKETLFPAGKWKNYWTGKIFEGETTQNVNWSEDKGGNLFIREGGIIPMGPLMQYRGQTPLDKMEVYVFPSEKSSSMDFYEDDGVSFKHIEGEYSTIRIAAQLQSNQVSIKLKQEHGKAPAHTWSFVVALNKKASAVYVDGTELDSKSYTWDSKRMELKISEVVKPFSEISIKLTSK